MGFQRYPSNQITPNLVIRPSAMTMATHSSAMMTVQRFRFFSATPEVPAFWVRAAAEHIGQAAALASVHEDEQREQHAEQDQNNLHNKLDNFPSVHR